MAKRLLSQGSRRHRLLSPDQAVRVAEEVVKIQRDFGNRSDRGNARLKYTIEGRGVDWFKKELPPDWDGISKSPGNSRLIPLRTVTDGPKTRMENGLMDFL